MRVICGLFALLFFSCGGTPASVQAPPAASPVTENNPSPVPSPVPVPSLSGPPDATVMPDSPPAESDAEDSDSNRSNCAEPPDADILCTTDGIVAGRFLPVDMCDFPDDAQVLFSLTGLSRERTGFELAVRGDEVWIRRLECAACRRILGTGFHGFLDRMAPLHRKMVAETFGLPAVPASAASLRSWARSAAGRRQLNALARAPRNYSD